jgi:uncharacterized membrane protein YdfJ with MMPL/SSD domain
MKSEFGRIFLGLALTIILIVFVRIRAVPMMLFLAAVGFGASYLIFYLIEKKRPNDNGDGRDY